MSSFCFLIVQMLKFRSDMDETKIISLLQKANFNISVMLGKVTHNSIRTTTVHRILKGSSDENVLGKHHKKILKNN